MNFGLAHCRGEECRERHPVVKLNNCVLPQLVGAQRVVHCFNFSQRRVTC